MAWRIAKLAIFTLRLPRQGGCEEDIRRKCDQFRRVFSVTFGITHSPLSCALRPTPQPASCSLFFGIVSGQVHEHVNAPHRLPLLRARSERLVAAVSQLSVAKTGSA